MGSYHEKGGSTPGIDAVAGSLVWVRRRNGSWWPGRVLGWDELPGECSVPPRSGTPIQLLGRVDGSMDWYNLEKSTRVKPFRCGEYDKDIESAKASANKSDKKAPNGGKYIHREDAILHALELESLYSSSGSQKDMPRLSNLISREDCSLDSQPKSMFVHCQKPSFSSKKLGLIDDISTQELSQSVVSFEEPNSPHTAHMQTILKKRWKTPYDSEDDDFEEARRTRGLQDLGLGKVSGRKPLALVGKKGSHALYHVSSSPRMSKFNDSFSDDSPISNPSSSFLLSKRKQSLVTKVRENYRKKSRHLPLVKVLEGTTRISIDQGNPAEKLVAQETAQNELKVAETSRMNTREFLVDDGSDNSGTSRKGAMSDVSENTCGDALDDNNYGAEMENYDHSTILELSGVKCSDSCFNSSVAIRERETRDSACASHSCAPRKLHPGRARRSDSSSQVETIAQLHEGLGETGSASCPFRPQSENGKLRSNLGRKKKSRYVVLSRTAYSEGFIDKVDQSGNYLMERAADSKIIGNSSHGSHCQMVKCDSSSENVSDVPQNQASRARNLSDMNYLKQGFANEVHVQAAEDAKNLSYTLPFARYSETLFTGDVAVSTMSPDESPTHHASTYPEYEVLEPDKSELGFSQLHDVKLNVQRSYHGPCVPLVSLRSKLDDIAIVGHPVTVEILQHGSCADLLKNNKGSPIASGTHLFNKSRPKSRFCLQSGMELERMISGTLTSRTCSSKNRSSRSRKSRFSSRKIRRLSLITVDRRGNEDERKPVVEKIGGTAVACVPLRLVFSRINEALSNPGRSLSCI